MRALWFGRVGLFVFMLWMVQGCKQQETCPNYAERQLLCAKQVKDKEGLRPIIWNFCHTRLNEKKTHEVMKQKLHCLQKKACSDFMKCRRDVEDKHKIDFQRLRMVEALKAVKRWEKSKQWYKAQHACTEDKLAVQLSHEMKSPKRESRSFYQYCLEKMPGWLKKLGQQGSTHSDFRVCYDSTYLHRSKATQQQARAIQQACVALQFAQKLHTVRKKRTKYLSLSQFPWQCNVKETRPLKKLHKSAAQTWLRSYQQLCYHDIGFPLLQRQYSKLIREKSRYCGYYPRKIMAGFLKWRLGKPAQQKILHFFKKLCQR